MKNIFQRIERNKARFSRGKELFAASLVVLILLPGTAWAAGLTDIITLLNTITGTIRNVIGGALSGIQSLNSDLNNFRQQVVWPVSALNQTKAFVNSTRNQYQNLMNQIHAIQNNSATLTNPAQLESFFRSGQGRTIAQMSSRYTNVYTPVPLANSAKPMQRNLMDMDDALAIGSLKTSVIADQTTTGMLKLADSIEQQSSTAAPGSGPMLATESEIASLESQAYLAKILAAELRQEAVKLAHQNALMKESAAATRNLQNQIQQVLSHP